MTTESEPIWRHRVVIDAALDVNDQLTGYVEHVGPVTDACHAYERCETCALALQVVTVDIDTAIEQLRDLIDYDDAVHGVHHAWFDGEAYVHTAEAKCYLDDWQEILLDEIKNLIEEFRLTPGRYRVKHMTLNEDECEIELDPQSLPSLIGASQ